MAAKPDGPQSKLVFRKRARPADLPALRLLVDSTGVFYPAERAIALELLEDRLRLGARSGYEFIFASRGGELVGYCAWGNVPLTEDSYDLYWIAVAPHAQGLGIGQRLMELAEECASSAAAAGSSISKPRREPSMRAPGVSIARPDTPRLRACPTSTRRGDHKIVFCKTDSPSLALPQRRTPDDGGRGAASHKTVTILPNLKI